MVFRSFRMRQGVAVRRFIGIVIAVGGLTILLSTAPRWVWLALLGTALMGVGWFLYHQK